MSIKLKQVGKRFGHQDVLYSIDLEISEGEFVAILGPSGCGKTTLLRMLAGFEVPSKGEIYFGGEKVASSTHSIPPEKRNIGMVFQSFALWPHLNVREHIRVPLRHQCSKRMNTAEENIKIGEILNIVGLEDLAERLPNELSGGQKQRVSFARAIAANPRILLMDEPLSSLDVELRMEMRREIQKLHLYTGATIIYVTHDQGEALAMADRIMILNRGRIEQIGTPLEIFTRPKTEFTAKFVGKANLIKGKWEQNHFFPNGAKEDVVWFVEDVEQTFKDRGIFPVRPELLQMDRNGWGIKGKIINAQYQGKEIHYTIQINQEVLEVHGDPCQYFQIGEEVFIHYKYDSMTTEVNKVPVDTLVR